VSQLRKLRRSPKPEQAFAKYGERAVHAARICRSQGLRDLIVRVEDIAEITPSLAGTVTRQPICQNAGIGSRRCRKDAVLLVIAETGFRVFYCEEHAEKRVVRIAQGSA
jgi:hypothetical protein